MLQETHLDFIFHNHNLFDQLSIGFLLDELLKSLFIKQKNIGFCWRFRNKPFEFEINEFSE